MTQEYTPVSWQDETTSQQGTLINAERLNQMQTAHHYADGLEEVDAIPTADPGVEYHKIVYCTADSTIYRWDGTEWTADIDDETKQLLEQEIARATAAEGGLAQDIADEATARETADTAMQADISALQSGKLDKKTAGTNQTQVYAVKGSAQRMITAGYGPDAIPLYNIEQTLFSKLPTLWDPIDDTVINYGWATAQIGAEATARAEADTALGGRIDTEQARAEAAEQANAQAIANTYTKAEIDTALGAKADKATTYTKTEADALLALKADQATTYTKAETDTLLGAKANADATVNLTGDQVLSNGVKANTTAGSSSASATLDVPPRFVVQSTSLDRTASQGVNRHYPVAGLNDKNGKPAAKLNVATTDNDFQVYLQGIGKDEAHGTLMLAKFDRGTDTWSPTMANDALDAYLPMVRTTGNQTIGGIKTIEGTINGLSNINNGRLYLYHGSGNYWRKKINILQDTSWCGMFMIKSAVLRGTNGPAIFVYQRRAGTSDLLDWIYKPANVTMQVGVNDDGIYVFQNGSDGLSIELLGQIASQSDASSIISMADDAVPTDPVFRVTI